MADNAERIKEKYRDGAEDKRASQSRYGALEFEYTKRHLEEFIHEGADVIELGCGTGYYAMHFSSRCRTYLGVDMVPEHIAILEEKIRVSGRKNVRAQLGDATALTEVAGGSFDVVLCLGPMYHLPDRERELVFAQCRRILKPGGIAAFAYINKVGVYAGGCIHDKLRASYPNEKANRMILEEGRDDLQPELFFYTMPEEMEEAAARHGFVKLKNLGTDFFITMSIVEAMSEERFALLRPLLNEMASHGACTGMSNHALLVCRKSPAAER